MKLLCCLVCLTFAMVTAGCVVPTPQHGLLYGRGMINEETTRDFRPDITTRETVLLLLGEPAATFKDQRVFLYIWGRIVAYMVAGGGYSAGELPIGKTTILLIEFDEGNCLKRFEYISGPFIPSDESAFWGRLPCFFYKSVMKRADEWISKNTIKDISTQEK